MRSFSIHRVEALETRSLQSGAASGLADSITVNPRVASSGTVVTLTFTEKNVSHHQISVDYGPQTDGFVVKRDNIVIWESNVGIQPAFVARETLNPGQSFTTEATWDGRSNQNRDGINFGDFGPSLSGRFTVTNDLAAGRLAATVNLAPANHR